jgi:hypothetical protein
VGETGGKIAEMAFVFVGTWVTADYGVKKSQRSNSWAVEVPGTWKMDTGYPHAIAPLIGRESKKEKGVNATTTWWDLVSRETEGGIQAGVWANRWQKWTSLKRDRGPAVFRTKEHQGSKSQDLKQEAWRMVRKIACLGLLGQSHHPSESAWFVSFIIMERVNCKRRKNRWHRTSLSWTIVGDFRNRQEVWNPLWGEGPLHGTKLILSLLWRFSRAACGCTTSPLDVVVVTWARQQNWCWYWAFKVRMERLESCKGSGGMGALYGTLTLREDESSANNSHEVEREQGRADSWALGPGRAIWGANPHSRSH